eukprot:scaffold1021_cov108-Isochrysis_galbana.AAC.9
MDTSKQTRVCAPAYNRVAHEAPSSAHRSWGAEPNSLGHEGRVAARVEPVLRGEVLGPKLRHLALAHGQVAHAVPNRPRPIQSLHKYLFTS